jgi:hypothetical protein
VALPYGTVHKDYQMYKRYPQRSMSGAMKLFSYEGFIQPKVTVKFGTSWRI